MGSIIRAKKLLYKAILLIFFFTFLSSCKGIFQGPNSMETPLFTEWSLSPVPGVYPYNVSGLNINVINNAFNGEIRYTTDGSDPIFFGFVYPGSINITGPCTVKLVSFTNGIPSKVYSAYYTFKLPMPTFTPPGGLYNTNKNVVLTDPTGAVIRFTTNGSTPNSGSSVYGAAIFVNINMPIKAYSSNTGLGYVDSDVATHNYVIMPGLFVKTTGNDANMGTPESPFATITHALSVALAGERIYVAAGSYNKSITIDSDKTVLGGYNNVNWLDVNVQDRENPTYKTEIIGDTSIAVTITNCNNPSRLQGFTIRPAGGPNSYGIQISGGSPLVRLNTIHAGSGSNNTMGIYVTGSAAPQIQYNIIWGGTGSITTRGIFIDGNSNPRILQNVINGSSGSPGTSYGIYAGNSGTMMQIFNNLIFGGTGTTSYAIHISIGGAKIFNNTISSGSKIGATTYGFYANPCSDTSLTNNVFFTDSTGGTHFAVYINSGVLTATEYNTYSPVTPYGGSGSPSGTDTLAPVVLDVFKRPTAASDPSIQTGGTDLLSAFFTVDLRDNPRTVPWSRGCFEY
jgi:hypothetical protein